MCWDAKQRFVEHCRETQKTGGATTYSTLSESGRHSRTIQGLHLLCLEIPRVKETVISIYIGVLFYNSNIHVLLKDLYF